MTQYCLLYPYHPMNMNESNPWVWVALIAFLLIVFAVAIWGGFISMG